MNAEGPKKVGYPAEAKDIDVHWHSICGFGLQEELIQNIRNGEHPWVRKPLNCIPVFFVKI
jgi:hypothetical protein